MKKVVKKISLNKSVITKLNDIKGGEQEYSKVVCYTEVCPSRLCQTVLCPEPEIVTYVCYTSGCPSAIACC